MRWNGARLGVLGKFIEDKCLLQGKTARARGVRVTVTTRLLLFTVIIQDSFPAQFLFTMHFPTILLGIVLPAMNVLANPVPSEKDLGFKSVSNEEYLEIGSDDPYFDNTALTPPSYNAEVVPETEMDLLALEASLSFSENSYR